jgi:hypothetical protein
MSPGKNTDPKPRDGSVFLDFRRSEAPIVKGRKIVLGENVSGLARIGSTLFCVCDETVSVERLLLSEDGSKFGDHRSFDLRHFFDFADKTDSEADLEGLAISDGYLWLAGPHSLKRAEPAPGQEVASFTNLVSWDPKRAFLARIPLTEDGDGVFGLARKDGERTAAWVPPGSGRDEGLRGLLAQEGVLQPFVNLPSKENGLDIEGLAVAGSRVLLGLRGPVIAGMALIVELHLEDAGPGTLLPTKIGGRQYRLHAVDLDGAGIRDLLFDGRRLLVLSGTSQKCESVQRIFAIGRLPSTGGVLADSAVKRLLTLPVGSEGDNAEGIALLDDKEPKRLLVCHDTPARWRLDVGKDRLEADVFVLAD